MSAHRVTLYDGLSRNAALVSARLARKSAQWRDVRRDGRIVTAIRVCVDCRADVNGDADLLAHFARHLAVTA